MSLKTQKTIVYSQNEMEEALRMQAETFDAQRKKYTDELDRRADENEGLLKEISILKKQNIVVLDDEPERSAITG